MKKQTLTLGIDIGGTNTVFGFVNQAGEIVKGGEIPTNGHESAEKLVQRLNGSLKKILKNLYSQYQFNGIGIGAPNGNYYTGKVENPPNLNWGIVNLKSLMEGCWDVPVTVTNDANAAALGEKTYGAAKKMKDFILITIGTGLGSGIFTNGQLVYGADGFAGELGHTTVFPNGRPCGCGKQGCLETYVSASGICKTVEELLLVDTNDSALLSIPADELTSKKVAEAAQQGDFIALKAFDYIGGILGMKLADAVAITSPEAIFLFGGLVECGDLILKPTQKYMEKFLFPVFRNRVKLLPSGLQNKNIAVLGASALALDQIKRQVIT